MRILVTIFTLLLLLMNKTFAAEPEYILQGREILSQWGEIYCIKKYSMQEKSIPDVDESLSLFSHSDKVYSLVYSVHARDAIFKYIDDNINSYGNLSSGERLNLLACVENAGSGEYKSFIKQQDRYLYQINAGMGAIIRANGQEVPFSGTWRMISKYGKFEAYKFSKGKLFTAWKSNDGASGVEWVLEQREDGGPIKLDNPYF